MVLSDVQQMEFTNQSVAFDVEAFNTAIVAHGVTLIHYQALPDPTGLLGKFDSRRPDAQNNNNVFNGFYYKEMGRIKATITNNSKEAKAHNGGLVDAGVAQLTAHTHYFDTNDCVINKRVYLSPYDRFYLLETKIYVPRGELVESNITGVDTLNFPCESVLVIVDSDGKEYGPDCYQVVNGLVKWNPSKGPSFNIESNKGKVYSIKYLLRPFYYVDRMIHELRLAQVENIEGRRELLHVNQSCIVNREYLFQNKNKNPEDPNQLGAIERPNV